MSRTIRWLGGVCLLWAFACGPDIPVDPGARDPGDRGPIGVGEPNDPPRRNPPFGKPQLNIPVPTIQSPKRFTLPPLQSSLETYELVIPEATLALFEQDPWAEEQPATFIHDGKSYPVNVRLRGASARTFPKKSWNVDFEDLRFFGREEINLVSEYQDQTMLVEKLAYDLLEAMGVPAPKTRFVRVLLNGKYEGVYLEIDEVDKKWVQREGMPDSDPSIYRCGAWDCEMKTYRQYYQGPWLKQTNESEPDDDLQALLDVINHEPDPTFPERLAGMFELDRFLRTMALDAIIANNYIEDSRSYYIHDRVTGRWYYVPWDLNNSDARWWPTYGMDVSPIYDHPLFPFTLQDAWLDRMVERRSTVYEGYEPTFCNLRTRILAHPQLREAVIYITARAVDELLDPSVLHPRIDAMHALLAPHMSGDPYMDPQKFLLGRQFVKDFVSLRYDWVNAELQRLAGEKQGLVIDAFDPVAGWIELANRGDTPVSTAGTVLTTYLRRTLVPSNVPARTLAPGDRLRLETSSLGLTLGEKGQLGLFDGQRHSGVIDVVFYGPLSPGRHYARDGDGHWAIQ